MLVANIIDREIKGEMNIWALQREKGKTAEYNVDVRDIKREQGRKWASKPVQCTAAF
jgi:hypothetical protein